MSAPLKTCGNFSFHAAGDISKKQELFSIVDGVDAVDALQIASNLLSAIDEVLTDAGMGQPLSSNSAWLLQHAVESAKAAVDAVQWGLERAAKREAQP